MSQPSRSTGLTAWCAGLRMRAGAAGLRGTVPRHAGWLVPALAAVLPLAAFAQTPPGMIVIPGNGEPANGASINGMVAAINTPGYGALDRAGDNGAATPPTGHAGTSAESAAASPAMTARPGDIVIPGNGEPGTRRVAMNVMTVPPAANPQASAAERGVANPAHAAATAAYHPAPGAGPTAAQIQAAQNALTNGRETTPEQHASAAPRAELAQLQQRAATELQQVAPQARRPAPPIRFTPSTLPMPSLPTIQPGLSMGSVAPVGMRAALTAANAKVAANGGTSKDGSPVNRMAATGASATGMSATGAYAATGMAATGASMTPRAAVSSPAAPMAAAAGTGGTKPLNPLNPPSNPVSRQFAQSGSAPQPAEPGQTASAQFAQSGSPVQALRVSQAGPSQSRDGVQPVVIARAAAQAVPAALTVASTAPAPGAPIDHSVTVIRTPVPDPTPAPVALPGQEDPEIIMNTAEDFLRQQVAGLPGRVTATITPITPRGLAACTNLEAFMGPGAPVWGRTTVAVRCVGEKPWTLYMAARVSVQATYYIAGRTISPGEVIQLADLLPREGDLSVMPRAIVTDPQEAVGAVAQSRLSAGMPLRTDLMRSPMAIELGQTVQVVAQGDGFSISTDGNAMNNANPGQQVKVKTSSGQIVVGTAAARGIVQIPM